MNKKLIYQILKGDARLALQEKVNLSLPDGSIEPLGASFYVRQTWYQAVWRRPEK